MFAVDAQECPAGDQHLEERCRRQQVTHQRCGREHLLKVVEHEQQVLIPEIAFETLGQRLASDFLDPKRLRDGSDHQVGLRDGRQLDEKDAVGEVGLQVTGYLQAQARLADAGGTDQGQEPYVLALQ